MLFRPAECATVCAGASPRGTEDVIGMDGGTRRFTALTTAKRVGISALRCCTKLAGLVLLGGFLCATLVRWSPGFGVDEQELDSRLNAESVQALRNAHASEASLPGFYVQYWRQLLHGDLGFSRSLQEPVSQLIRERSPETLKSVGFGLLLGWALGLPLAIVTVMRRSAAINLGANLLASVMLCIPAGVLALLCVLWEVPGRLVLGMIVFPKVFEYTRNLLLRSAAMPHVVTAKAKGLGPVRVFAWHVLPTSGPQLLALGGISLSLAFAGAIPVEVLCDIPGIGQLAWTAAMGRDLNLLVFITLGITAITLLANSAAELGSNRAEAGAA